MSADPCSTESSTFPLGERQPAGEQMVLGRSMAQSGAMRLHGHVNEGGMTGFVRRGRPLGRGLVIAGLALGLLAACGDGDDETVTQSATTQASEHEDESHATGTTVAEQANACPADGCTVRIVSVARADGELEIAFEANFLPDISKNHFHVFWDTFSSEQVSGDAQPRFGVAQGVWAPTGDNPYTTADAVSVAVRGASSRICVAAGDRYHNVIDPKLYDCRDVSEFL